MDVNEYTYKELLELSAKAYGCKDIEYRHGSERFYYDDEDTGRECWNPLDDDGQALRLAIKLKLKVDCLENKTEVFLTDRESSASVNHDNDPFACTRLAIVSAAYEIGKSL